MRPRIKLRPRAPESNISGKESRWFPTMDISAPILSMAKASVNNFSSEADSRNSLLKPFGFQSQGCMLASKSNIQISFFSGEKYNSYKTHRTKVRDGAGSLRRKFTESKLYVSTKLYRRCEIFLGPEQDGQEGQTVFAVNSSPKSLCLSRACFYELCCMKMIRRHSGSRDKNQRLLTVLLAAQLQSLAELETKW